MFSPAGAAFDKLRLTQSGVGLAQSGVTLSLSKRDASTDAKQAGVQYC